MPAPPLPAAPSAIPDVAVLNATRVPGLARAEADRLLRAGYRVGIVTNHSDRLAHSSVRYAPGARARAARLARREHIRRVQPMSRALRRRLAPESRVVVLLGADRTR